jgi:hypothetical protein
MRAMATMLSLHQTTIIILSTDMILIVIVKMRTQCLIMRVDSR